MASERIVILSGSQQITFKYLADVPLLDSNEQKSMHRITFSLRNKEQWYGIMRDANMVFGKGGWRTQPRTLRKLKNRMSYSLNQIIHRRAKARTLMLIEVWFEFPQLSFVTAMVLKYGVTVGKIESLES